MNDNYTPCGFVFRLIFHFILLLSRNCKYILIKVYFKIRLFKTGSYHFNGIIFFCFFNIYRNKSFLW